MDPTKHASVPLSQITATRRLDAGYHLAVRRAASHMSLFADLPPDEAVAKAHQLVAAAPKGVLFNALSPLETGSPSRPSMSREQARTVVESHPHLSLALLHKYLPEILNHTREQWKQSQQTMNAMMDFSSDYPPPSHPTAGGRKPGP